MPIKDPGRESLKVVGLAGRDLRGVFSRSDVKLFLQASLEKPQAMMVRPEDRGSVTPRRSDIIDENVVVRPEERDSKTTLP